MKVKSHYLQKVSLKMVWSRGFFKMDFPHSTVLQNLVLYDKNCSAARVFEVKSSNKLAAVLANPQRATNPNPNYYHKLFFRTNKYMVINPP